MRTFIKYQFFTALFILLNIKYHMAQIPSNDNAWLYQTTRSDSFNYTGTPDGNKWWTGNGPNDWGAEVNYPSNVTLNGSTLKIKADNLTPNFFVSPSNWNDTASVGVYYAEQSGVLQSTGVPNGYKFGYIEVSAKYPTGKYSDWPAFWLYWNDCTSGSEWYNEIDIAENGGSNSKNGYRVGTGFSVNTYTCANVAPPSNVENISTSFLLSSGFHKYAVEWAPDRVIWYIDDLPVRTLYDVSGANIPQNPLRLVLNFAIDPWNSLRPSFPKWDNAYVPCGGQLCAYDTSGTNFPHYFEIDHINYYKLGVDCTTDVVITTPSGYDRKVKNSVATNAGYTFTYNPSTAAASYTIRADNYVLLNAPTGSNSITIDPSGTGYFAIDILPCPQ